MSDFDINKESYDILPELVVSKIINTHTKKFYTRKNKLKPYEYDLKCYKNITHDFIGYIEVEHSNHEQLSGENWYHSFLMRKIFEWNDNQYYDQILKPNADKTVYIKFNKYYGFDDCICCCIEDITRFNPERQNKTGDSRLDLVLRTDKYNPHVAKGIMNCIDYIEKFFNLKEEKHNVG